jgi:hypothetical protein
MSFAAEDWAWNQHCGSGIAKAVLGYLAFRADRHSGECWPSLPNIVRAVEHTERAVRHALDDLVQRNLVERERRHAGNGRCISTRYRLPVASAAAEAPDPAAEPAELVLGRGVNDAAEAEPTPAQTQGTLPSPTPAQTQGEPSLSKKDSTRESESACARAQGASSSEPRHATSEVRAPSQAAGQVERSARPVVSHTHRGPRGTPLPDDWAPSADDRHFARSLGLDPNEIMVEFADHHHAMGSFRADWSAAWRRWCRDEPAHRARKRGRATKPPRLAWMDDVDADLAALRAGGRIAP